MGGPLRDIWERVLSEAGLAGAFLLLLLTAVWKLHRDLIKAKDALVSKVEELKEKSEEKYRQAIDKNTETVKGFEALLDRLYDYLTRKG